MDNFRLWILALLLCSPAAYPLSGPVVATENVKARLVSETDAIGPGQSVSVALELNIREGWHTYWRNPGDSGQATSIVWNLPAGFTASGISWPAPHRFELAPLVNYGYARHVMLLVKITAPKILPQTPAAELQAKASWLVCADVCVPEEAQLNLRLPQGPVAAPPAPD
ncbi:MAG: thiol:disulfide interchange protein, partial [Pseudomonadota bacterium]|nr:thiol:disulfide interchange protein [Pseudomonadota bacterium]